MSSSQFNRIKPGIKNNTEGTSSPSSNVIGDTNDGTDFLQKSFMNWLTSFKDFQNFKNNSTANIKLPKIQLSKIVQSQGFIGRVLGP